MFEETICFPCSTVSQAARYGRLDEIKRLIQEDHPCDVADNRGWRAIHEAAHGNYLHCLQYLLEQGVTDANWQSFEGITPLQMACEEGGLEAVKLLLESGADPNLHDHMDTYPIHCAVKRNIMEMVEVLVGHGARTNVQLYCGTSPLHQAAAEGYTDMVRLLLESGARLDIREDYDITPIFSAAHYGQDTSLRLLLETAVQRGEGQLVDSAADDGATPLYLASQEGHIKCVRLLLKHNADPNLGPRQPKALPLHAALQFNRIECVRELLPYTNRDSLEQCDLSPFYFSTVHTDTSCTQALINAGISPSHRYTTEDEVFKPRVLRYFLTNVRYSRRMSPLVHVALNHHPIDQVTVLLDGAACLDARTPFEVPALLAALECKNLEMAEMLIRRDAKVNIYHPKIISNMCILLTRYQWKALNLMLLCGAEAESLFAERSVTTVKLTPACQRLAELEDALSDYDEENYENEVGLLRFPIPFWRNMAEARVASGMFASTQMLKRILCFVGNVHLDPHLEAYVDSKQDWKEICSIIDSPRPLTHLCRLVIRHQMSARQLLEQKDLRSLPMPEPIIEYLLYTELDT